MQTAGSASGDFHLQIKNTVLNPRLAEFVDVKPGVRRVDHLVIDKSPCVSGPVKFKAFKGRLNVHVTNYVAHFKLTRYLPTVSQ